MVQITFKVTLRWKGSRFDFNNNLRAHNCSRNTFIMIFRKQMQEAIKYNSLAESSVEVGNVLVEFTGEKPNDKGVYT